MKRVNVLPKWEFVGGKWRTVFFLPDEPAGRGKILAVTHEGHAEVDTLYVRKCRGMIRQIASEKCIGPDCELARHGYLADAIYRRLPSGRAGR